MGMNWGPIAQATQVRSDVDVRDIIPVAQTRHNSLYHDVWVCSSTFDDTSPNNDGAYSISVMFRHIGILKSPHVFSALEHVDL